MSIPKLVVENVTKSFRANDGTQIPVLTSQSMAVEDREFVALLGPSGCGKSTLLRIINGLIAAETGRVLLNGEDVTGKPGKGRAMVFQTFDLFPWRTALGNVEFGLEAKGLPADERRRKSLEYLRRVGLEGFVDAYPHQLTGGMQQRVGIARAFAVDPDLLLMDEPFGALDVQTRDVMQDELLSVWEADRKTVLFVTHGIEEAIYLADRILVFSPRPARVLIDIRVPFGRPRQDRIKIDPLFIELRREIGEILRHGEVSLRAA
jgi:NitT/TauT family transport system ATP-binding protein